MSLHKFILYAVFKTLCLIIIIFLVMVAFLYRDAKETVQRQIPELIRLVAEDNCLDDTVVYNGKTIYKTYISKLDSVSNSSDFVKFDTNRDAVSVTCDGSDAYSRASAKQRGCILNIKLTGYFRLDTEMRGISFNVPITFEEQVIGTRYYRDRG